MIERVATCRCGQLRVACTGDPIRVSVCHCLECQKRSGSAFATQARWPEAQVEVIGTASLWSRAGDSGSLSTYRFCPACGATMAYVNEAMPGMIAVPVGAFADPKFPSPRFSVYEERKHAWVAVLGDDVDHQE
ncbi:GFA family protein [Sphingomonas sp. LM7]|uniref:GFA family protein n=1 Tax=Sphingomonas sp. LM7 TaxID=1938607 RepID=UPI000983C881|nr:GFA family protein [Sphingomonas sp. LM7]AQR73239.1 aldehyde-activating protein [Sphingomonas sp. LM7]